MHTEPPMIDDARVLAIEIRDNGERLIDASQHGIRTAREHPRATSPATTRFWCRRSVVDRLILVGRSLPYDIDLVLTEAHRPLDLQRQYCESGLKAVQAAQPGLSTVAAETEAAKCVAPPRNTPPHSTGGAVDVILMAGAEELGMGCELNEQCDAMRTEFGDLTPDAMTNRQVLLTSMQNAGFVHYGHEWWHYSYGDRYWAHATGVGEALFGGL